MFRRNAICNFSFCIQCAYLVCSVCSCPLPGVHSLSQLPFLGVTSSKYSPLTGVLSQSGLSDAEQRELVLQLVHELDKAPVSRVPDAPNDYIARVKDLLFSVFLPRILGGRPLSPALDTGMSEFICNAPVLIEFWSCVEANRAYKTVLDFLR